MVKKTVFRGTFTISYAIIGKIFYQEDGQKTAPAPPRVGPASEQRKEHQALREAALLGAAFFVPAPVPAFAGRGFFAF